MMQAVRERTSELGGAEDDRLLEPQRDGAWCSSESVLLLVLGGLGGLVIATGVVPLLAKAERRHAATRHAVGMAAPGRSASC